MVTQFWARLEDAKGRVQGPDPAWVPQRQFLWDVVHDTRGALRAASFADDLALIRRIDRAPGQDPAFSLEPKPVREFYARIYEAVRAQADAGPRFRWIAPEGSDAWSAVCYFREGGTEYALVGGWTGPFLRTLAPEPDQSTVTGDRVTIGARTFRIRIAPFAEVFREDFENLLRLLEEGVRRGLRVRFLQR